jgi:dTDP-4-dehydrorhamnose 3,5-epimerase
MEFVERKLKGSFEISLQPNFDVRGFFLRTFDRVLFKQSGLERMWVQENHSRSVQKYILRGLHFQIPPFQETKLIRCIKGSILDVLVDLRPDSRTFGEWDSIILSEKNMKMIFIPRGFAHGFCTLTKYSEIVYKVDNFYSREHERGIIWNDNDLQIAWPTKSPILSEKDKDNPAFKTLINEIQNG